MRLATCLLANYLLTSYLTAQMPKNLTWAAACSNTWAAAGALGCRAAAPGAAPPQAAKQAARPVPSAPQAAVAKPAVATLALEAEENACPQAAARC